MTLTDNPTVAGTASPASGLGNDRTWHLFFGLMTAATLIWFIFWSKDNINPGAHMALMIVTIILGCFMAFNIGGNDVANSFGTSVGAGTLSMKQALLVAAVFEVGGALLAGGEVTDTVKSGIVDLEGVDIVPIDFAYIMLASLVGAALWLLIATMMGWPVSTTHSIIGGIVGAAVTTGYLTDSIADPWAMVQWGGIIQIVISWFLSPVLGGIAAFLMYGAIKKSVLVYNDRAKDKLKEVKKKRKEYRKWHKEFFKGLTQEEQLEYNNAMARDAVTTQEEGYSYEDLDSDYYRKLYKLHEDADDVEAHRALVTWVPILAMIGGMIITSMMLFKGLKNTGLHLSNLGNLVTILMIGAAIWMAVYIFANTMKHRDLDRSTFILFSWMQVFTASAFAFSHGSNDIANAVGPFAAVLDVLKSDEIRGEAAVPTALMVAAGVALISGLWFIGRKVISTVGTGLTKMHPATGFAAELSAAGVVMVASLLGLPVSSTHILIGAILGVGLVNKNANWGLMRPIALAWVITVPAAAAVAAVSVMVVRAVFGA